MKLALSESLRSPIFLVSVDPRPHGRPLLPEEMDSIRRILSRNLHNFNNKVLQTTRVMALQLVAAVCRRLTVDVFVTAADSSLQQTHTAPGATHRAEWEAPPPTPQPGRETLVQHHRTLAAAGTVHSVTKSCRLTTGQLKDWSQSGTTGIILTSNLFLQSCHFYISLHTYVQ